jgi:hypothetical protein
LSPSLWIVLGVAIILALCYVLCMRALVRKSREIDKQIDCSKIRPCKGDDGKDSGASTLTAPIEISLRFYRGASPPGLF